MALISQMLVNLFEDFDVRKVLVKPLANCLGIFLKKNC